MPKHKDSQETFQRFRHFFSTEFKHNGQAGLPEHKLKEMMEHPLLKRYLFSDSMASIIDHAKFRYLYLTEHAEQIIGIPVSELMKDGPRRVMDIMGPKVLEDLMNHFQKAVALIRSFPREEQTHLYVCYTFPVTVGNRAKHLYQQVIPLSLDASGMPAIAVILLADVTSLGLDQGLRFRLTLNLPGKPARTIYESSHSVSPLSSREAEIVRLLADGLNSVEIAKELYISEDTVRTHRRNILAKTNARNVTHAVMKSVTNGWV